MPAGHKGVRVRLTGRVQGVWFRGWTVDEARRRGLDGWVRNRIDGSVEALFAGPAEAVDDMIAACRLGPAAARVEAIEHEPAGGPVPAGFTMRPTE